ncbi:methyltransferase domain-containing protein [Aurantiacibacter xanthus]|uniref:Methyltransferase domain-containing protein n=1 Tax=Aurantiacibacter xanthus TaxID=1784712 RepID=A0A3A1PAT3_9SPHN|nr:methyltransferase domain-containing protein [Aurantiacibacter xanthus]RIV90904.1 methyltransferase domain-containing protein [Aurantiacibacter xanthus]
MSALRSMLAFAVFALLAACQQPQEDEARGAQAFPKADRPVSGGGATSFSNEEARDRRQEADTVMDLAGIEPGMTVADVGAGEGYYTVRLAARVGENGRVLASDINEDALRRLGSRVERDRLDNVSIKPGLPDDPRLPVNSFDRILLVHMYHEVEEPYAFLWHLRPALRENGHVVVVDVDRPADEHGISPQLLFCEFARVGYRLTEFVRKPEIAGYYAEFEAAGERPEPGEIKPCVQADEKDGSIAN